jgi:antitoxin (DNA-binding transcriptional repressor) of toxin-antitoxin stability system
MASREWVWVAVVRIVASTAKRLRRVFSASKMRPASTSLPTNRSPTTTSVVENVSRVAAEMRT